MHRIIMKTINIPFRNMIKSNLEANTEKVVFSTEWLEELKQCKRRAQAVLQSCLDVEEWIKDIIGLLLFNEENPNSDFIKGVFLDSDFCMFNSKIKILNQSLNYFSLFNGKKRNEIENLLPKINKLRNKLAHGKIYLKDSFVYISYFEGKIKEDNMNDEYWAEIETLLNNAHYLMEDIEIKTKDFNLKKIDTNTDLK